jgi:hypothetical protein
MLMIFDLAALGDTKSKITTGYFADMDAPGGAHRVARSAIVTIAAR